MKALRQRLDAVVEAARLTRDEADRIATDASQRIMDAVDRRVWRPPADGFRHFAMARSNEPLTVVLSMS